MRAVEASGARVIVLGAGDAIRYGESRADILFPTPEFLAGKEMNDTALAFRLASGGARVLFTGDMGPSVEGFLAPLLSRVDVLKVAHHGSKFSSTQGFLDIVRPLLAAIEVGENGYGHPSPDVLARLQKIGARVFRTDRDGTVEVVADGTGIKVFAR
jgi:competence protein ComEC